MTASVRASALLAESGFEALDLRARRRRRRSCDNPAASGPERTYEYVTPYSRNYCTQRVKSLVGFVGRGERNAPAAGRL